MVVNSCSSSGSLVFAKEPAFSTKDASVVAEFVKPDVIKVEVLSFCGIKEEDCGPELSTEAFVDCSFDCSKTDKPEGVVTLGCDCSAVEGKEISDCVLDCNSNERPDGDGGDGVSEIPALTLEVFVGRELKAAKLVFSFIFELESLSVSDSDPPSMSEFGVMDTEAIVPIGETSKFDGVVVSGIFALVESESACFSRTRLGDVEVLGRIKGPSSGIKELSVGLVASVALFDACAEEV